MSDPYKILNIHKNFNLEELKEAYKKAAFNAHPDRNNGNDYFFKLVIKSYKHLRDNYKNNEKEHGELKDVFKKNNTVQPKMDYSNFNIQKFNDLFEGNHVKNKVEEVGYGKFLKDAELPDKPDYDNSKYNNRSFNDFFEKKVVANKNNKYLMKYREPAPMENSSSCSYLVLGQDNVDDYSSDLNSSLKYSDLKIAHTTSRIIDPKTIKERKQYNSVEELKMDRENLRYTMNDRDKTYYDKKEKLQQIKEAERLKKIKVDDDKSEENYNKIMRLFNELK
jgi:curved DNA-binding protein CbpA